MMPRKVIKVGGIPVKVVSNKAAEKVDFVVCLPLGPSRFNDNLTAFCCKCGIKVMYRWHAPRKPPKICLDCANKAPGRNITTKDSAER